MRVLGDRWLDGYLDYDRPAGQCRVKVQLWEVLAPIQHLYFIPPRDWRIVINYLCEVGPRQLFRKALSRSRERLRNAKYISCGVGEVVECDAGSQFHTGQVVVFVAPCHPRCVDRLTLPEAFIRPLEQDALIQRLPRNAIVFFEPGRHPSVGLQRLEFAGWSEFSGSVPDARKSQEILKQVRNHIQGLDLSQGRLLATDCTPVMEAYDRKAPSGSSALRAVLFGYGHYAKSTIIPNLPRQISLVKVHEVDPCQVGRVVSFPFSSDSSAYPHLSERYDAYFIAGFHHTHSAIAVHALRNGAFAVVEKPITTTFQQLDELMEAMARAPGKFFAGFHKRYSTMTQWAIRDLCSRPGEPISYHSIVYEVKLPALHWYRWPNSKSRIVSNGCHWVDHFLFLNHFSPVHYYDVWEASNGDIFIIVELSNGASFSMTLTDHGSPRIGVQEYMELRAGDITVGIQNGSRYVAEDSRHVFRRRRVQKMESYQSMYRTISRTIVAGLPGDSLESVDRSSRLILDLEERLAMRRRQFASACDLDARAAHG